MKNIVLSGFLLLTTATAATGCEDKACKAAVESALSAWDKAEVARPASMSDYDDMSEAELLEHIQGNAEAKATWVAYRKAQLLRSEWELVHMSLSWTPYRLDAEHREGFIKILLDGATALVEKTGTPESADALAAAENVAAVCSM